MLLCVACCLSYVCISAFEVEEAKQARMARPSATADEERGLLRSARAADRTLSEVSSTEGVLIEIANEQVWGRGSLHMYV